eukprot:33001_1
MSNYLAHRAVCTQFYRTTSLYFLDLRILRQRSKYTLNLKHEINVQKIETYIPFADNINSKMISIGRNLFSKVHTLIIEELYTLDKPIESLQEYKLLRESIIKPVANVRIQGIFEDHSTALTTEIMRLLFKSACKKKIETLHISECPWMDTMLIDELTILKTLSIGSPSHFKFKKQNKWFKINSLIFDDLLSEQQLSQQSTDWFGMIHNGCLSNIEINFDVDTMGDGYNIDQLNQGIKDIVRASNKQTQLTFRIPFVNYWFFSHLYLHQLFEGFDGKLFIYYTHESMQNENLMPLIQPPIAYTKWKSVNVLKIMNNTTTGIDDTYRCYLLIIAIYQLVFHCIRSNVCVTININVYAQSRDTDNAVSLLKQKIGQENWANVVFTVLTAEDSAKVDFTIQINNS